MTDKKVDGDYVVIDSVIQLNPRTILLAIFLVFVGTILLVTTFGPGNTPYSIGSGFMVLIGLVLMFEIEKMAIRPDEPKLHIYRDYFLFKIGKKYDCSNYKMIVIFFDAYNSPDGGHIVLGIATNFYGTSSRHYEVFLLGENKEKLLLREFDSPGPAKKMQIKLGEKLNVEAYPKIVMNSSPDKFKVV